jgi:hypothetical protein
MASPKIQFDGIVESVATTVGESPYVSNAPQQFRQVMLSYGEATATTNWAEGFRAIFGMSGSAETDSKVEGPGTPGAGRDRAGSYPGARHIRVLLSRQ